MFRIFSVKNKTLHVAKSKVGMPSQVIQQGVQVKPKFESGRQSAPKKPVLRRQIASPPVLFFHLESQELKQGNYRPSENPDLILVEKVICHFK